MAYDLQVGAIGAVITLTLTDAGAAVDLTNATTTEIILRGPQGPRLTRTATRTAPYSGGIVTYTTVAGDVAYAGPLKVQAHVEFSGGSEFWSSTVEFAVGPNI
jgi:hypothetical protein